ncbi:HAMP domain-containing sensor histidine kinase [Nibrella saemangeumensis]|uniref:histidine kinase n=1 Tax=Nibrella saemangeumensis TaxID=1084526 RepID=A0ABP8NRU7_9BACT
MQIKTRIALQFSSIVAAILVVFSLVIYFISSTYRQEEFYERLRSKALTTVRYLIDVKEISEELLRIIDKNSLTALLNEKVLIFDEQNRLIYSSVDDEVVAYPKGIINTAREQREIETVYGDLEVVAFLYEEDNRSVVVLAMAHDKFGKSKLGNLRNTLIWGLLVGLSVTIGLGIFFAGQSLRPISRINEQISTITARNLRNRLDEGNRKDEIAHLAINFNRVLQRLDQAFEQQRSFVSHASHELRTPLAALKSEIQIGLRQRHSADEYQAILENLMSDTDRLISLTNNLLFLARTLENISQMPLAAVRVEDVLFLAKEELVTAKPGYQIDIDYENLPDAETETMVRGNEELLKRVLLNLLDNACKYSADNRAKVRIRTDERLCTVTVKDNGIGISEKDQENIFQPFYRAANAVGYDGFGVGLSICQKIIELHQGVISVTSRLHHGSSFIIQIPHL